MKKQNLHQEKNIKYKSKRKRILEISFICSLLLLSALFYSFKKFDHTNNLIIPKPSAPITAVDVPITKHPEKLKRFELPPIPIPSEDDEFCPEVDYDLTKIDIEKLLAYSASPIGDEEESYEFIAVSEKPEILVKAIPYYPELARKAGISGQVVTRVLIDKAGNVETAEILKSIPMLDAAALDAAKRCKFKPGKQRDKYVKVWMAIPFKFVLK
jgi:protein TonB